MSKTLYDLDFYQNQMGRSISSADEVVPIILDIFGPSSVLDLGCGVGGWLGAFAEAGISDYLGVDGDYVDIDSLKIPKERFKAADLSKEQNFRRRFDLAISLEVAEHLTEEGGMALLRSLTSASDIIVFSAAIPHQGGVGHINEQWQSYWSGKFAALGYETFDCIRSKLSGNPNVSYYYRQNILVFCRPGKGPEGYPAISPEDSYALDRVDPEYHFSGKEITGGYMYPPENLRSVLGAFRWALRSYLSKR